MRVYLPATLPGLARLLRSGRIGPAPVRAFAVTPALRESYASGDLEELEYAAMTHAARASLRLLLEEPDAPRRRVVLAADVPDSEVRYGNGFGEAAVAEIGVSIPLAWVVSGHIDDPLAAPDIQAAVVALPAADKGDEDARFTVDGAEGHELLWYATQELAHLAD